MQDSIKAALLERHVDKLRACRLCPNMQRPAVSGGAVVSEVLLVGQAPGAKEPIAGKPFAWTAGKTLFSWFSQFCAVPEEQFRARVYMAAVCRCFPGKKTTGGDRVPSEDEIRKCGRWLDAELEILRPRLVIPVGKLAISQFLPVGQLTEIIGRQFEGRRGENTFDIVPLPHPSGASPWHRMEPGKTLLRKALRRIHAHPAFRSVKTLPDRVAYVASSAGPEGTRGEKRAGSPAKQKQQRGTAAY